MENRNGVHEDRHVAGHGALNLLIGGCGQRQLVGFLVRLGQKKPAGIVLRVGQQVLLQKLDNLRIEGFELLRAAAAPEPRLLEAPLPASVALQRFDLIDEALRLGGVFHDRRTGQKPTPELDVAGELSGQVAQPLDELVLLSPLSVELRQHQAKLPPRARLLNPRESLFDHRFTVLDAGSAG